MESETGGTVPLQLRNCRSSSSVYNIERDVEISSDNARIDIAECDNTAARTSYRRTRRRVAEVFLVGMRITVDMHGDRD